MHRREHAEFVHGVAMKPLRDDRVVKAVSDSRIILVTPRASVAQRKRVEKVANRANWEMNHTFGIYCATEKSNDELQIHALIGCENYRAVALLIFERRSNVWSAHWGEDGKLHDQSLIADAGPRWTIGVIWVLKKCRRRGIALKLLEEVTLYTKVPTLDLVWYCPLSPDGEKLVKRLCPTKFFGVGSPTT